MSPASCPCCGAPLPDLGIRVDLNENVIFIGERWVTCSPRETEFAEAIWRQHPIPVPAARIIAAIYGADGGPLTAASALCVYICRLRQKLRAIGGGIENINKNGSHGAYRFVRTPTAPEGRRARVAPTSGG